MIVKTSVVVLILGFAWIKGVHGAAFSNVFLEHDVAPVEYYQYGPPSLPSAHLSQTNAAPVQYSVPSVSGSVPPCGSPCIIPSQTLASVPPSPNVLTYKSSISNVPVVVTPTKDEPLGYEYSYVVYDENTGDHKAQRELSDGSVVRGEYSFIQPDGYVREVQYVADDVSGFNAIVKNFLPVAVEGKHKVKVAEHKESGIPCHDVKIESIKEHTEEVSEEKSKEKFGKLKVHHEIKHEESKEETIEESEESKEHSKLKESGEKSEESEESKEHTKEEHEKKHKKESNEDSKEAEKESREKHGKKHEHKTGQSKDKSKEELKHKHGKEHKDESGDSKEETETESKEEHGKMHNAESIESKDESEEESREKHGKKHKEESGESKEESKRKHHHKSQNESKHSESESKNKSHEKFEEIKEIGSHATHAHHIAPHNHEVAEPEHEAVVSYHDILRCVQAAINRANETPGGQREEPSPLTYIILNKPC